LVRRAAAASAPSPTINPENLTVGQLLGALKPAQLWGLVATIVTALAAVFSAALALGHSTASPLK
jgi:uncharacterized protein involved in exopolysaccharide biosynthesis